MDKSAEWLEVVAKHHNKWIKIVNSFGEYNYASDIVQEMYIALYKYTTPEKIIHNGKLSEGYIFFTLKTILFQFYNQKNKVKKVSIDDEEFVFQLIEENNIEEEKAYHKICELIDEEMSTWSWYNRTLTKLYRDSNMSIRKIASETNISFVSIFNTLKKCKQQLKNQLYEEWQDYKAGEFERIKNPKK